MIRELGTDRLRLEPLVAEHAAKLYSSFRDPSLYDYIPQGPPASMEALAQRYRRLERRRAPDGKELWLNWAVREVAADLGYVGLVEATVRPDRTASIAYFVFAASGGRGYGREAVAAVLRFLLHEGGADRVTANIDTRNARSIRLVEGLGFVRAGFIKDADVLRGRPSDEFVYELTSIAFDDRSPDVK